MFSVDSEAIPVDEPPCTATKHLFECANKTGCGTVRCGPAPQHAVRGQELPERVSPLKIDVLNHSLVQTDATFSCKVQPRGLPLLVQVKLWSAERAASLATETKKGLTNSWCAHKTADFIKKLFQKQDADNKV